MRIPCEGNEMPMALAHYRAGNSSPGFSGWGALDEDLSFAAGAYIPARQIAADEIDNGVLEVVRSRTAFVASHAADLVRLDTDSIIPAHRGRNMKLSRQTVEGTVGDYFDIVYGLKSLHNKEALSPGRTLLPPPPINRSRSPSLSASKNSNATSSKL